MERLWAPWRYVYIESLHKQGGCIFCEKPKEKDDEKNLILKRGKYCFIILNLFPYNSGHIMVAPYSHKANLEDLTYEECLELMELVRLGIKAIKRAYSPDGFNVGINIGKASGAGFEEHVHVHIVPRWVGDTNFMPIIGDTKVIPEFLKSSFDKLKNALKEVGKEDE